MERKAHSREMLMALPGDQEWESQLAKDTYEKQSSLKGDVNGAAREIESRIVSWPWTNIK